jgi:hypothetical protein
MEYERIERVKELIESGICEPSRLQHILDMLEKNRPLYNSDEVYLDKMSKKLEEKIQHLQKENMRLGHTIHKKQSSINTDDVSGITTERRTLVDDADIDKIIESGPQKHSKKKTRHRDNIQRNQTHSNSVTKRLKRFLSKNR